MPLGYLSWATANESDLIRCDEYACVFCVQFFDRQSHPVVDFIQDRGGRTGICPTCGIDAVVPLDNANPRHPMHNKTRPEQEILLAAWNQQGFGALQPQVQGS